MNIAILGISFRTAPLAFRESLSFGETRVPALLEHAREAMPDVEFVLLSTCNRTELYAAGPDIANRREALIRALLADGDVADDPADSPFYFKSGMKAVEHLLAVATSLDSMVVGETEVLGQVKKAYLLSGQAGASGKQLDTLFAHAFHVAKRVHAETDISRGRVSVSSIAVEFAEKIFGELAAKNIMIVGSGEMAELTLKSLVERPVRDVVILNRSLDRAQKLAATYDGEAKPFDSLPECLPHADIVISSTGCPHCVIDTDTVREASHARRGRPMLLVDIAVPRDIEPGVGDLEDVYLYHIDDLQKVAEENMARRQEVVGMAWTIVREAAGEFARSLEAPDIGQIMRQIDDRALEVREAALKWALAKPHMVDLPDASREQVVKLAELITGKLLDSSKTALRKAARNGSWDSYTRVARDLLGLQDSDDPSSGHKAD